LTGGLAAIATLLLTAGTALGGGWATIAADAGAAERRAGETDEFGFTVLQHGETPAGWVNAALVIENVATGKTIRVAATAQGADGHFVAMVTFPEAGYWSWRVDITDLIAESPPRMLTVLTPDGALPPFDPTIALTMIERAKADIRNELHGAYQERVTTLETQVMVVQSRASNLEREQNALSERLVAAENGATSGAAGGIPLAATLALAVLGGAAAGFVMASLGRRGGRTEESAPTAPEYAPTAH
jgi:hypothetical protein